nr:MAG TPA: antitoxin [Caudoviricetes sp.]
MEIISFQVNKMLDLLHVTVYNVTRNKEVFKISSESRADYMKERRKKTRNFSVELDREKFEKLEKKLSEKGVTKKKWLNDKVDEEIEN